MPVPAPQPTDFDFRLTALDRAVNLAATGRVDPNEVSDYAADFEAYLRGAPTPAPPTNDPTTTPPPGRSLRDEVLARHDFGASADDLRVMDETLAVVQLLRGVS